MSRSEEWRSAAHALAGRLGTPIAVLSIVTENAPTPGHDVRAAQGRYLEEFARGAVGAGAIVDGAGFRASFVRAVVAGVTALARYKCPFRIAATDEEMAAWLGARFATLPASAARPTVSELCSFFAQTRAHLAAQPRVLVAQR